MFWDNEGNYFNLNFALTCFFMSSFNIVLKTTLKVRQ